jgi:hypothetical protein
MSMVPPPTPSFLRSRSMNRIKLILFTSVTVRRAVAENLHPIVHLLPQVPISTNSPNCKQSKTNQCRISPTCSSHFPPQAPYQVVVTAKTCLLRHSTSTPSSARTTTTSMISPAIKLSTSTARTTPATTTLISAMIRITMSYLETFPRSQAVSMAWVYTAGMGMV